MTKYSHIFEALDEALRMAEYTHESLREELLKVKDENARLKAELDRMDQLLKNAVNPGDESYGKV